MVRLILLSLFLAVISIAQNQHLRPDLKPVDANRLSDEGHIRSIIKQFVIITKSGRTSLAVKYLSDKIEVNNAVSADTPPLSIDFININNLDVSVDGNKAIARFLVTDDNRTITKLETMILERLAGKWKITGSTFFVKLVLPQLFTEASKDGQFLSAKIVSDIDGTIGGVDQKPSNPRGQVKAINVEPNGTAHYLSAQASNTTTSSSTSVSSFTLSNSVLVPRTFTGTDLWTVNRSVTQGNGINRIVFNYPYDGKFVRLNGSSDYFLSVTTDYLWNRIVFGKSDGATASNTHYKSYGDNVGEQKLTWASSIGADKFGNVFVLADFPPKVYQLKYDDATIGMSFIQNVPISGVEEPVDLCMDWNETPDNISDDLLWLVDRSGNAIFQFKWNGQQLGKYTSVKNPVTGEQVNFVHPTKVITGYNYWQCMALIDSDKKRFIIIDNVNGYQGNTILGSFEAIQFDPGLNVSLNSIGFFALPDGFGSGLWVADPSNAMFHIFDDFSGTGYLASVKTLSNGQQWANPIGLFTTGMSNSYGDYLDCMTLDQWDDVNGIKEYLRGADLVSPVTTPVGNSSTRITATLPTDCNETIDIYRFDNTLVTSYSSQRKTAARSVLIEVPSTVVGNPVGKYRARFGLTPADNSEYGIWQQSPLYKDVWFAMPLVAGIAGPSSAYSGQNLTWNATIASGSGDFTYHWYRQEAGGSGWSLVSSASTLTQSMTSSSFIIRCDVRDSFNGNSASSTQFVSHITLSGNLYSDEIWPGASAIFLTGSVTVPNGVNLTIQPGTTVFFPAGASLFAYGTLTVNGSTLQSSSWGYSPGNWGSIVLDGSGASGSSLNSMVMKNGTKIQITNTSSITVQNCVILNNIDGIYAYNCTTGSILNNTITNPRDHGINLITAPLTCNQNAITKASGNSYYHSGGGIICQAGSYGDIWQNTISGFNWGIGAIWGSSPQFRNVSNAGVNNSITNCLYGVMTYQYSYPTIGPDPQSQYFRRYRGNSIYNNQPYDFYADTYSGSDAYGAYWGSGPVYWLETETGCYFNYTSPLSPGRGPEPTPLLTYQREERGQTSESSSQEVQLPAQQVINQPTRKMPLLDGIELRSNGKFREAKDFFLSYIANYPKDQAAYVELFNCYHDETAKDIIDFFTSPPKSAAKEHGVLLSYLYLKKGSKDQAKQVNHNIISARLSSRLTTRAKLNNFYCALYNENDREGAAAILDEVLDKPQFSSPMELSIAQSALETFVSAAPGQAIRFKKQTHQLTQAAPVQFELSENYPNPFNPTTHIRYALPENTFVTLRVYDVLGREVATLVNEQKSAGYYDHQFDASGLSSGIYIYRLQAGGFSGLKKMSLVR